MIITEVLLTESGFRVFLLGLNDNQQCITPGMVFIKRLI